MKNISKKLFDVTIFFLTIHCFSQTDNNINIGTIDTIQSKILNETRKIWIHVPASANNKIFTPQVYPVLYLLDAPAHFHFVTGMVQHLSSVSGNTVIPEMIVVGIQNTDRTRDLTPTHSTASVFGQSPESLKTSGGGDKFLDFIEKELFPYIEKTYPVAPHRMLVGHSFGGLMAVHALVNRPKLFDSYVAIDPSLWWDDQIVVKKAIMDLKENKFPEKPFYLAIANVLNTKKSIEQIEKDTAETSIGIRSAFDFAKMLDKFNGANTSHWKYYSDDTHGSVPLIATYDAFHTFFKEHKLEFPIDPADVNVGIFINHYEKVSELMGYTVHPPEVKVYRMGSMLLELGYHEKAYEFIKLNMANYPLSFVAYDNMGDYHRTKGEEEKAIEQYKKALSLREFPSTRKKLEKLTMENE